MAVEIGLLSLAAVANRLEVAERFINKKSRGEHQEAGCNGKCQLFMAGSVYPALMIVLEILGLALACFGSSDDGQGGQTPEYPSMIRAAAEIPFCIYALKSPSSREDMALIPAVFSGTLNTRGLGQSTLGAYLCVLYLLKPDQQWPVYVGAVVYIITLYFHFRIDHVCDLSDYRSSIDYLNAQQFSCRHNASMRSASWMITSMLYFDLSWLSMLLLLLDVHKISTFLHQELCYGGVYVTSDLVYCSPRALVVLSAQWDGGTFEHTPIKKQVVVYKPKWQSSKVFMEKLEYLSTLNGGAIKPMTWATAFARVDDEVLKKNDMSILLSAVDHGLEEDDNLEVHWRNQTWNRRGEKTETATCKRQAQATLTWTLH